MAEAAAVNRRSRLFLALLLATLAVPALAESGMYRVEVLVFNHVDSSAKPR